jgi:hypothetical protein
MHFKQMKNKMKLSFGHRISQSQRTRQVMKYTVFCSLITVVVTGMVLVLNNFGFQKDVYANTPSNNDASKAILLTNTNNWISSKGRYTTLNATMDGAPTACQSNGPQTNVWFKFIAPANNVAVDLFYGSDFGTIQSPYLAIWDSSLKEIACSKYTGTSGDLPLKTTSLVAGRLYYISVDNDPGNSGTFTIRINATRFVPVELVNFAVRIEDKQAAFLWETSSESNNTLFTIEKSQDGVNYKTLGTRPGAGNSSTDIYYRFYDESPLKGTSYYRLKQTDCYGQFTYFPAVVLYNGIPENFFSIYSAGPNPFNDKLDVRFYSTSSSITKLYLTNPRGIVEREESLSPAVGSNTFELKNMQNLESGMYFLRLTQDGKSTPQIKVIRNQ